MSRKLILIEVNEADAISRNEVFKKDTLITFYNDTSKIKIADGKTLFNSLPAIGGTGVPPDVQTALNAKVDKTTTVAGKALSTNITLVKADVGLGSVDNTSDAAKPVSTATQTALNAKLTAVKAVSQPDSVATDVAGLVTDFNALLAALRTAGQML